MNIDIESNLTPPETPQPSSQPQPLDTVYSTLTPTFNGTLLTARGYAINADEVSEYFSKRRKNNEAARKSRDKKKQQHVKNLAVLQNLKIQHAELEEALKLKMMQLEDMKQRHGPLKQD